jgi:hypothetical protein
MSAFSAYLESWTLFYGALAGACAVFMGLIFLAVSLRMELFNRADFPEPRQIARQTFLDFLWVFVVAIIFLIPGTNRTSLGIIIGVLGAAGAVLVIRRWVKARRHLSFKRAILSFLPLVICFLGLVLTGVLTSCLSFHALAGVAPLLLFLLGVAIYDAWELMFSYNQ